MKIRWPVIIILLLSLVLALTGGAAMLWRFFIFLAVLLIANYIWLRLLVRQVEGRIVKTTQYCRVGDYFVETFTVSNNGRLPLILFEAAENTDVPAYHNTVKVSLASRGAYTWQTRELCRHRGQYRIGSLKAKIFDPLGFLYLTRELTDFKYINILPEVIDLPYFQVLPRREPGLEARRWFAGEPGHNASRVREYTSGDRLRHIHWHSTAHTGQLMVKEFDPDLTRSFSFNDVWIILDMHRGAEFGEGNETTSEYGIKIAASLAKKYLETDKTVGLMASGDRSFLFIPEKGEEQAQRIHEALASIKPTGEVKLESLIASQEERITEGSAAIIITPGDYQSLGTSLHRLISRGITVTAVLLDAASFGGKTAAADTARPLSAAGINVYTAGRGMEISRALDVRHMAASTQYSGLKKLT